MCVQLYTCIEVDIDMYVVRALLWGDTMSYTLTALRGEPLRGRTPGGKRRSATLVFWRSLGRVCYFGCLQRGSKSVHVLFHGIEAVMVLTLILLK